MARHKNPRYRPMPPGWQPAGESVGAGLLASSWSAPDATEPRPDPRPWIENPLSRPQAEMLVAASAGTLRSQAGKVTVDGRYASVVTLRALRERGLMIGTRLTYDGREALARHGLEPQILAGECAQGRYLAES